MRDDVHGLHHGLMPPQPAGGRSFGKRLLKVPSDFAWVWEHEEEFMSERSRGVPGYPEPRPSEWIAKRGEARCRKAPAPTDPRRAEGDPCRDNLFSVIMSCR